LPWKSRLGKQAKILSDQQTNSLLVFASTTRHPHRNKLIVLFSLKAGLRAGEIAKLTWDMVLGPSGEVGLVIELRDCIAKKKGGRLIPIHPGLRAALAVWRKATTGSGPIIRSERGGAMTRAARLVHKAGGSLRDVQLLAGHRSIQTTQRYIDGDTDAQRKLVSMI
jgi:integrase